MPPPGDGAASRTSGFAAAPVLGRAGMDLYELVLELTAPTLYEEKYGASNSAKGNSVGLYRPRI